MKVSEFFFKSVATCAVLSVVFAILGWVLGSSGIFGIVYVFLVLGGIAFVGGIIASIWEA